MPTLPRDVPAFEKIQIGGKPLPGDFVDGLKTSFNNLYDLRDFVLNWFVDNETPSGLQDGTNKTFQLQFVPMPPESLKLFISRTMSADGVLQIFGVDYILTGSTIVFQTAPSNSDFVRAYYRKRLTKPSVSDSSLTSQASALTVPPPAGSGSGPGAGGGSGSGGSGLLMGTEKFIIYNSPGFNAVF
jgi:hypothetical protein